MVRPDQYVALTLPLDGYDELDEFFARFMNHCLTGRYSTFAAPVVYDRAGREWVVLEASYSLYRPTRSWPATDVGRPLDTARRGASH